MSMNDVLHVVARDHLTLAPDGTPINYINPTSRGTACQIVGLFTLVLAFIIVVLRMGTKTFILRKFGWDDYTAVLAMLMASARVICIAISISVFGFGRHVWDIPVQNNKMLWRLKAIGDTLYPPAILCAKLSILFFYLQIFKIKKWFRYSCWFLMVFDGAYLIAVFWVYMFYCSPAPATWNYLLPGKCVDGWSLDMASGALNIFSDTFILLIPAPLLWHLHLSTRRKIAVSAIFLVGAFTVAASITREIIVGTVASKVVADGSWVAAPEALWLTVEMNVSIMCGSLLILPNLFRHIFSKPISPSVKYYYSRSHPTSNHHTNNSKRPIGRKDHFHRAESETSLELGEILVSGRGRTDTVVVAPEEERWEREEVGEGAIQEIRTYTVA